MRNPLRTLSLLIFLACLFYGAATNISKLQDWATRTYSWVSDGFRSPKKAASSQFFVDVWKLRQAVAVLEPLQTSEDTDSCYSEGDEEDTSVPLSPEAMLLKNESIKRQEEAARACSDAIAEKFKTYKTAYQAFNNEWLPLLTKAIESGDRVAEVILRQCSTTPVLDRSNIESTCDANPQRRDIAAKRLKEIGFAPAFDYSREINTSYPPTSNNQLRSNRAAVLEAFRHGAFGVDFTVAEGGSLVNSEIELKDYRRWALIEAANQDAQRMFTFRARDPNMPGYPELSLNRHLIQGARLLWGKDMIPPYSHNGYWRSWPTIGSFANRQYYFGTPVRSFQDDKNTIIINLSNPSEKIPKDYYKINKDFEADLRELLSANEKAIDSYLQDDPRWGIFLLQRIGHHEFIPQGMVSESHEVSAALIGDWVLEKHYIDWKAVEGDIQGAAKISRDGEFTRISINSKIFTSGLNEIDQLPDINRCLLRKSGGQWPGIGYEPIDEVKSRSGGYSTGIGDIRKPEDAAVPAYSPFYSKNNYEQILMQCQGAEANNSDRVRFLLLAGDTLVEFSASSPVHQVLHIRHYKRRS